MATAGPVGAVSKQITVAGHTYSADPGNLTVLPGDVVRVTIAWWPTIFRGSPERVVDCLYFGDPPHLGGRAVGPPFDTTEQPPGADPFTTSYTVPGSWEDRTVCDRALVTGEPATWTDRTQRSNQFCFTVEPPPALPEAPLAALFVALPVVLGGGWYLVGRRRRAAPAQP